MMRQTTQLSFICITLIAFVLALSILFHVHFLWLALPFSLILMQLVISLWLPQSSWFHQVTEQDIVDSNEDSALTIIGIEENNLNNPSFENYLHIKKALASHQKQFPTARTHNISAMANTEN